MLTNLVLGEDQLSLSINGGQARFDYFWLRDNARDPVSFDTRSNQRELFTAALDPQIHQATRGAGSVHQQRATHQIRMKGRRGTEKQREQQAAG